MKHSARSFVMAFTLLVFLAGCSAGPRINFYPADSYPSTKLASQNVIKLSEVQLEGDLSKRKTNILPPIISGITKENNSLTVISDADNAGYHEGELFIKIHTTANLSAGDYWKRIPLIGAYSMYGGSDLTYNWNASVDYEFKDVSGNQLKKDTFTIVGKDIYKRTMGEIYSDGFLGGVTSSYPDADTISVVGDKLLELVGEELSKRLFAEPIRQHLLAREKQRDGMDIKTYIAFLGQMKRLESERKVLNEQRLKDLDALIQNKDQFADLGSGTVMVLGIGVSKYESTQIPSLKFADRDSERVVGFFKKKYKLSDDRAMLLKNDEATATKISRFITQNAMRLLDKDDTFILYFSGHGAPDVDAASHDNDGLKKYLLLHDSDLNALPLTALNLDNLASMMEKLPCRRVILLLDSCFAGTAGAQTLARLKSVRISDRSYKNISVMSGKGRVILAASSENQVSHEDDRLQSGVFTHFLLKGLNGNAGIKGNERINILGLYEYVTKEVSKQTDSKQIPVFRGSLDENIIF